MALNASVKQIDLSLATKAGYFTNSDTAVAAFTTDNTTAADQAAAATPAYELSAVKNQIETITGGSATHAWKIDASAAAATAVVIGTDYADSILAAGTQAVTLGLGKDTLDLTAGAGATTLTVNDYNYDEDVIQVKSFAAAKLMDSISGAGVLAGGASKESLQLKATDGYYKVHITTDGTAANTAYLWKGSDTTASVLDGSEENKALTMISGASSDTLIGGSKSDTIYATAEGAYAFGGVGSDDIILGAVAGTGDALRQYVAISTESGKDSVAGFSGGFADTNDVLVLRDGTVDDISFTTISAAAGDNVIKFGSSKVTLNDIGAAVTGGRQILVQDKNGILSKVVGIDSAPGAVTYTPADSANLADYYIGISKAEVSFAAITDDVVADLGNSGNFEDNATFKNIVSVTGGTGNNTLVGAADTSNYIVGGAAGAHSTLWGGGASNDTLIGGAGVDAFFVAKFDGNDTIGTGAGAGADFQTGTDADTADTLYMLNSPVASLKNDGTNTTFTFEDGSSVVLRGVGAAATGLNGAGAIRFTLDGTNVQTAVVGKSTAPNAFTYSSDVNMYFGGSKDDTLSVTDGGYDAASLDIRLNNTGATTFSSVETVNASAYSGKAFISGSDESSEVLIGGSGKTTLWGGLGAVADTLRGTTGDVTSFYFGSNNGNDIIATSDSDDKVVFYDFANTDLTAIDNSGSHLKFTFNDGSSLEITGYTSSSVQTFEFTNSSWTYDKSTKTFTQTK